MAGFFDPSAVMRGNAFAGAPVGSMNNYIGGALPWNPAPSPAPTSIGGLNANYQSEYGKSMAMNQANYQNVLSGYQNLISQQNSGYQSLYNTVLNQLQGAETGRKNEIGRMAQSELGTETQGLINRGLGNTTVQNAVASGVEANKQNRLTELSGQFAQLRAGYQQQLGQAQLSNLAGLSKAQLDFMTGVNAGYPDAGMYGQLASQFGQAAGLAGGANSGRNYGGGGMSSYGGMGIGGPRLGYTSSPTNPFSSGGYSPAVSTGGGYNWMAGQGVSSPYQEQPFDNSAYYANQGGAYSGGGDFDPFAYSGGGDF